MPRRRRATFTPKKANKSHGGDPTAPTEAEWRNMTEFGSFVGAMNMLIQMTAKLIETF